MSLYGLSTVVFPVQTIDYILVAFSVQVLACDMKAVYQTISVDASSGVPTNSQELIDLLNNTWSNWTGPTTPQDSLQMTVSKPS